MAEWLFEDAPTLLAVVDEDLLCRRASRGWRERLGLRSKGNGLAVPLSKMFLLHRAAGLVDQLRDLLQQAMPLQNIPVSLISENGVTEGLLYAWPSGWRRGRLVFAWRPPATRISIGRSTNFATCARCTS